jgi:hypothetical protein
MTFFRVPRDRKWENILILLPSSTWIEEFILEVITGSFLWNVSYLLTKTYGVTNTKTNLNAERVYVLMFPWPAPNAQLWLTVPHHQESHQNSRTPTPDTLCCEDGWYKLIRVKITVFWNMTAQCGKFQRNLVPPPSWYPEYSILHAYTVYTYEGYADDDDGCCHLKKWDWEKTCNTDLQNDQQKS